MAAVCDLQRDRREDSARGPRRGRVGDAPSGLPRVLRRGCVCVCDQTCEPGFGLFVVKRVQSVRETKRSGCSRGPVPVAPQLLGCVTPPQLSGVCWVEGACSGGLTARVFIGPGASRTRSLVLVW